MQFTDVLCYTLLMITMAATCIQAGSKVKDVEERKLDRRMSRRTATVIVDSAPAENRMFHKPKVMVRRLSKKQHPSAVATYAPRRTKYGPPRGFRKPGKKYRSKASLKHSPTAVKKRASKPRYGPPKRPTMKPVYGPPKRSPHCSRGNSGFGEPPNKFSHGKSRPTKSKEYTLHKHTPHFDNSPPPTDFGNDFSSNYNPGYDFSSPASFSNDFTSEHFGDDFSSKPRINDFLNSKHRYEEPPIDSYDIKQGYGEPPVDSYGAPIQPNLHDLTYSPSQSIPALTSNNDDYNLRPDSDSWKNTRDQKRGNSYMDSKPFSAFPKPGADIFVTPVPDNHNEELHLNSYSDIYNFRQMNDKKKKPSYYENVKLLNQPWKGAKLKEESSEEVIVGGQYAEPPARYVPKFQPSAPVFNHDDNVFSPPRNFPEDHDLSSATISSYVNYKNSNMAFSPQNLNDVFSIVDK